MGFFRRGDKAPIQETIDDLTQRRIIVHAVYAMADVLDQDILNLPFNNANGLQAAIRRDLVNYMLYLAVSNNSIEDSELAVINDFLGTNLEAADCGNLLMDQIGPDFLKTIPQSFVMMKQHSNVVIVDDIAAYLISLYDYLGTLLALADGYIEDVEREAIYAYVAQLRKYIRW